MFNKFRKYVLFKALFIVGIVLIANSYIVAQSKSNTVEPKTIPQPAQLSQLSSLLGGLGEIDFNSAAERHISFLLVIALIIVTTLIGAAIVRLRGKASTRSLWFISILFSALCILGMIYLWNYILTHSNDVTPGETIVLDDATTQKYLSTQPTVTNPPPNDPPVYIPTGVFIQSVQFKDANDTQVDGYLWQKWNANIPSYVQKGVILPEAAGVDLQMTPAYTRQDGDTTVYGWSFTAIIREQYYYDRYPFDHQTMWLRMWATDFDKNVFLVPDFAAYSSMTPSDLPGIEHDFVLENWSIDRSYFSYKPKSYNVNFGIADYTGQQEFPELHFNVDISRAIVGTFVGYIIPPIVVAILMFAALLIITRDANEMVLLGSNTVAVLFYLASLFFIIILLHINLRTQIQSERIIYIEYFYFAIYIAILLVSLDFVFYTMRIKSFILDFRDNLIPKLLFWPLLTASILLVTIVVFF